MLNISGLEESSEYGKATMMDCPEPPKNGAAIAKAMNQVKMPLDNTAMKPRVI